MAQTNFTPILLYASSTPTNVPTAGNLTNSATGSEIAINIADKNLFFKDSGGSVNTVPIRQSGTSSNGWLSATDWNTFNGKAPATSGTSILYGNGSGGFSNVTIGSGISFAGGTLSATGSGGTVTSVTGTSPVVSSGGTTPAISLATAYGDTLNPYASKTAKYVLAAPNAIAGVPTFRQLANTDITGLGTMSTQNANSVAITGGTLNGVAIGGTTAGDGTFDVLTGNTSRLGVATGTSFVATNGLSSTSTFTGTAPTDGIVIDYSTGYGRFSAFTGDGYQWYTGGIGTTKIMDLSSAGALVTSGTVTANGVLLTGNTGTVTSVAATAGTGISVSGSPITTSGTLTITNTAPDQTVVLTAGTGISTSGTYPNFTITNTSPSSGGTVTSVTGTAPVVSSGGNTPAISMAAATTSVNGYLTSTDWTTFNNKQAALVSGTNIKTVNGTTLLGAGDVGIISGTYGGTGVNNGASTITIGGSVSYVGAYTQTWTRTANTSLTLPTSGYVISTVTNMAANPVTGTPSASNFLRGDGTWAVPTAGSGTVTSVAATVPAFLSVSGSPITTSGTLAITLSGTALPVANGGTGITTTPSNGQIPIGNGTNYTAATLTAGSGISITNASGSITVANTQNTGPTFSAYKSTGSQSITSSTATKITYDTELFDTNNNFASSRFTPTVAGYYQISASISTSGTVAQTRAILTMWKTGNEYATLQDLTIASYRYGGSQLVYLNGTTDYVEIYAFITGTSPIVEGGYGSVIGYNSMFSGVLVRGA